MTILTVIWTGCNKKKMQYSFLLVQFWLKALKKSIHNPNGENHEIILDWLVLDVNIELIWKKIKFEVHSRQMKHCNANRNVKKRVRITRENKTVR